MKKTKLTLLVLLGLFTCSPSIANEKESETEKMKNPTNKIVLSSEVKWEQMNPARGDKSPLAATLWGDRKAEVATGYLGKFVDGFSSPPHIHNVTYRAIVIKGSIHNDDPAAEKMWMKPGSFWVQPVGEAHITAAKGEENLAYIEIDNGPYLVWPADDAFENKERALNIDAVNLVWSGSERVSWIRPKSKAEISFLWEGDEGISGFFVKLPEDYKGKLESFGQIFYAIVIQGELSYDMPNSSSINVLDPGSCFSSEGRSIHEIKNSSESEIILYIRTNGKLMVN